MDKRKNIFARFFGAIGHGLKQFSLYLQFLGLYIIVKPLMPAKTKGKGNVRKNDIKVFVTNHYEVYGPVIMYLRFPYSFRPWVIDRIMTPESVEAQMSTGVYNNFPKFPMWFKKLAVKALRNLMVFTMKHAKAISVSRENPRANIKTLQESTALLNKGKNILIFPEESYVTTGVGKFQTGFEHLAKYYHQKTGNCISFYPVFISKQNKTIYIEKPITFNPENDTNDEKQKIVEYLYDSMINSYVKNECSVAYKKAPKLKRKRR